MKLPSAIPSGHEGGLDARSARGAIHVVILSTAVLAAVFVVASFWTMWRMGADATILESIRLALFALFALGAGSYMLRFLRWHVLVARLAPGLTMRDSLRVYMAGFALGMTPARAGEVLKFSLLKEASGVRELQGLPVFVVERATEAASFFILATLGAVATHASLGHVRIGTLAVIAALPALAAANWLRGYVLRSRSPREGRARRHLQDFLRGLVSVTSPRTMLAALLCALAARSCDAALFWLATQAVGLQVPFGTAAMAFGVAGLAGGLSLLPAGVGAVEGTLVATLGALGSAPDAALAAALLARFMTLWIWIPPGLWCALRGVLGGASQPRRSSVAADAYGD